MKTGFKNPIAVKDGKKMKNPWNFDAPPYDERSSCYVNAGTNYGVGHTQPVGRSGNPKQKVDILPEHRVKGMEDDFIHKGRSTNIEISEEK